MINKHCDALRKWLIAAQTAHPEMADLALGVQPRTDRRFAVTVSGFHAEATDVYLIGVGADPDEALHELLKQA